MNYIIKLLSSSIEKCKEHNNQILEVCYESKCTNHRFICKDSRCRAKHNGHALYSYRQYEEEWRPIEDHIKLRQGLQKTIQGYKKTVVDQLARMFDQIKINLFSAINSKYCSNHFLQIEKVYKSKKEGQYIPLIQKHKEHFPQKIYKEIQSLIFQKQKYVLKTISKLQVAIDLNAVTHQKVSEYTFNQKQIKIKSILPFKCDLKLRFKASQNEFLTKKQYAVNIRGPIVLYVESHKNRHFGGYSSIMFPKYQEDYSEYRDVHSFLFSLDHRQILPLKEEYKKYAIKGGANFGFGQGDLLISDECNKGNINWAEIGRTYKEPSNVKGPLNEWLGGASYFRVLEYEIYSVEGTKQK